MKLVKGRENRETASDVWAELHAGSPPKFQQSPETVKALLDQFWDWCRQNHTQGTYDIYKNFLQSFCDHLGEGFRVAKLRPKDVTAWLNTPSLGPRWHVYRIMTSRRTRKQVR